MKKAILAIALMAFVATPAFAAVQNVKLSGSVTSTYLYREHFDLQRTPTQHDDQQSLFITQTLLQVDADLTDQVAATIAILNERPWENDPSTDDSSELNIIKAFVEIRELLYSPLTVKVGRFTDWAYGNSFVFNATGTNNLAPTNSGLNNIAEDLTMQSGLDAIRFILDYNPLTIEAFVAAVSESSKVLEDTEDDVYLYGIVSTYELGDEFNSLVEGYYFHKIDRSTKNEAEKADQLSVLGVRGSIDVLDGLNLQLEVAHQGGTRVVDGNRTQGRDAWGVQAMANYSIPLLEEYDPSLHYVFTKVYGSKGDAVGQTDKKYTGWDPFFEAHGGGTIYNTMFDLTNLVIHSLALSASPMEDVTTTLTASKLYTHQDISQPLTLRNPDGSTITLGNNDIIYGGQELGTEIDFETTYDYTEDVQFGLNVGVFKPGSALQQDANAKQVLANVSVAF